MADLSPAAQAVLDAYIAEDRAGRLAVAAALLAAAEQVVPEMEHPDAEEFLGQSAWVQAEARVRFRLAAIAAELKNGGAQ